MGCLDGSFRAMIIPVLTGVHVIFVCVSLGVDRGSHDSCKICFSSAIPFVLVFGCVSLCVDRGSMPDAKLVSLSSLSWPSVNDLLRGSLGVDTGSSEQLLDAVIIDVTLL